MSAPLHPGALPISHLKEDISVAYATAVAAAIGVNCEAPKRDINGWDLLYRAQDTDDADAAQLAVQLKCTVNRLRRLRDGKLAFSIPTDDYNQLCRTPCHPPRILVVVRIPSDRPSEWVTPALATLGLEASAWWVSLMGEEPAPAGQEEKTVHFPPNQRFGPAALRANMRSCP